jgi:DNA-directed RNA polymerase specialized sigma24 family protein
VEISELLGLTPTATQSVLARARDAFRERWREIDQHAGDTGQPQ